MPQKQDNEQFLDPFGQFLAQAYLAGRVPGNQTSAYNTVLDLLSPGAMAGRLEAGVPNVNEQFASMFGGMSLNPNELEQMMLQQSGLQMSPVQEATTGAAMTEAAGKYNQSILEAMKWPEEHKLKKGELKVKERQAAVDEQLAGPRAGMLESLGAKYGKEVEAMDRPSPQEIHNRFHRQLESIAMWGLPWNEETGTHVQGEPNKEMKQDALKVLGVFQANPSNAAVIGTLLRTGNEQAAFTLIDEANPGMFKLEDLQGPFMKWVSSVLPGGKTGEEKRLSTVEKPSATTPPADRTVSDVFGLTPQAAPAPAGAPAATAGPDPAKLIMLQQLVQDQIDAGVIGPEQAEFYKLLFQGQQ
jgi:hypothetical protein